MADASQIMNLLLQTQTGEVVLEDDDPQVIIVYMFVNCLIIFV